MLVVSFLGTVCYARVGYHTNRHPIDDVGVELDGTINPSRCMPSKFQKVELELRRDENYVPNIVVFRPMLESQEEGSHRLIFGWAYPGGPCGANDYAIDALTELLATRHTISGYVIPDPECYVIHNKPSRKFFKVLKEDGTLGSSLTPNADKWKENQERRMSERMKIQSQIQRLDFCVAFTTDCPLSLNYR